MRTGAFFSAIFHIVIIVLAMTSFANSGRFDVSLPVNIPVEIWEIGAETNVSAAIEAEPEEIVEEQAPEVIEPSVAMLRPEPEPVIEEVVPEFSPFEEPEPVAEEPEPDPVPPAPQVRPEPRPQPAPRERDFFADTDFEALLDRTPRDQRETIVDPNAALGQQAQLESADQSRRGIGEANALRASIEATLLGQIRDCWNPPVGAANAEQLVVDLRVQFNADGTLRAVPQIIDRVRYNTDSFYRAAADAATRALQRCENGYRRDGTSRRGYDLPREDYDFWNSMVFRFDPSGLL